MRKGLFIRMGFLLLGVLAAAEPAMGQIPIGASFLRRMSIGTAQTTIFLAIKTYNPSPADEETGVLLDAQLSWDEDGPGVVYDVYLGTDPGSLALVSDGQAGQTCDPGILDSAQTYYWRVDATDIGGTVTGDVWEFTTATVYTLTIVAVGTGTVIQDPEPVLDVNLYYAGTNVTLIAAPDPAYDFDAWSGDLVSVNGTETVTMDADKAITATFTVYSGQPQVRWSIGTSLFPRVSIGVAQARPSTWTPPAGADNSAWWWRRRHSD